VDADNVSRTALNSAVTRAVHLMWDEPPHVLVDPYAMFLFPAEARRSMLAGRRVDELTAARLRAALVWRARTTEDALERAVAQGVRQYAILGAGFDSFALRRRDLLPDLRVFEIDHPATQAWKRERMAEATVPEPEGLHFVPADLSVTTVRDALATSAWAFDRPGFFCWTGVAMYLSPEVVAGVLAGVAALGAGTEISFTYLVPDDLVEGHDRELLQFMRANASRSGEHFASAFTPEEIESIARAAGFDEIEHHEPTDSPYFRHRRDRLVPHRAERLVVASVGVGR
jgi:methyltransferase (TIGR00027 family)